MTMKPPLHHDWSLIGHCHACGVSRDTSNEYATCPAATAAAVQQKRTGAMAESVHDIRVVVSKRPGGIHRLLCRVGLHAWAERFEGTRYSMQSLIRRCAVCGVSRG